ncbi:unnamed protein product (macronuclear) [Paramecium tetraurelia]|uniref:Uncharacterized protein n=1 Tax=Paramecium tetraurelia TaxID=5888 RepID=A0BBR0_PARTE|nr:uncharacterized protein GSPATT00000412001 [Paramecium tetraurelia]CAK55977.1 unnamed protein product [Paramecium tetraurelia]|eukprot:XP_001423375.1 hypothetical protein (macronuclear) [Paramecium tetraurelia strain d4-2]
MDYNIIKAKFYLLFPSLTIYNQFKHRHALKFTDEYMNEKIQQYISKLNEDKMMQQNKWEIRYYGNSINSQIKGFHLGKEQQLKYGGT